MNKKGQSLSLNTIIIGILVVLVLIVLAVFFIGGFGSLSGKIKNFLGITTAGTDLEVALLECQNRCQRAQSLPENLRHTSAYCVSSFLIDRDNNNEIDTVTINDRAVPIRFFCDQGSAGLRFDQGSDEERLHLGESCPGVTCR